MSAICARPAETLLDDTDKEQQSAPFDNGPTAVTSESSSSDPSVTPSWWRGHWSPLWVVGTLYLLLFIVYLGFAEFGHKPAAFILHSVLALNFCVACAANLFHTPSHGPPYRKIHIWTGWIAMWSGAAVVGTGFFMVFRQGYEVSISTTAQNTFIGTGLFQLVIQVGMIWAIRYAGNVWYHMMLACFLFYGAALMPAVNRMPQIFHFPDSDAFTFAILPLGTILIYFAIAYYSRKMEPREVGT
uniref:Cytochrome b561 domain-containing protein n=1 Tax=Amphora coffeiformis TaxID=265554 RepID=A0A7S3KW12_9STRA|mmetsp:Transcript_2649/g.5149  ORF Transcript_2649/g.5149 Transcript_2649/m.5149 type:complete len:243 (-) Transcript_2649:237-965(-)